MCPDEQRARKIRPVLPAADDRFASYAVTHFSSDSSAITSSIVGSCLEQVQHSLGLENQTKTKAAKQPAIRFHARSIFLFSTVVPRLGLLPSAQLASSLHL